MRSSQHDLMWRQLLPKVRKHDEPLQVQLCTAFVTAMLEGRLPAGTRLESKKKSPALLSKAGLFLSGQLSARKSVATQTAL